MVFSYPNISLILTSLGPNTLGLLNFTVCVAEIYITLVAPLSYIIFCSSYTCLIYDCLNLS